MKKFKTVLSLFDGISGTQVALERNGITYDNYYASEIDKYPISITQKNYPNTIQLGSVTDWREWDIDWFSVDLVCGGFPCQSWSVAGLGLGDKDVRGMLFWTMLDVMKLVLEKNPNAKFLMENVRMKKEFEEYITFHTEAALGKVNKHLINSALVSAQNRKRFYWTNIDGIEQPQDLGIMLSDCLESQTGEILYEEPYVKLNGKTKGCVGYVGNSPKQATRIYSVDGKSQCITALGGGQGAKTGLYAIPEFVDRDYKAPTVTASGVTKVLSPPSYRKLTPNECELLQTFPQGYTEGVSNTQRYRSLGNSFTVNVVAEIFKYL